MANLMKGPLFDKVFGSDEPQRYTLFNPQQQQVADQLTPRILDNLNRSTAYNGQLSAPMSAPESDYINRANMLNTQQLSTLGRLSQFDPQSFNTQFNAEIAKPQTDYFTRELLPQIQESIPSFSTAQGQVTNRALQGLNEQILGQRFAGREAAQNRALDAIRSTGQVQQSAGQIASVPRVIQQLGLDRRYADYVKGNEQAATNINQALAFLGMSTEAIGPSEADTNLQRLLALLQVGGQAMAAGGA